MDLYDEVENGLKGIEECMIIKISHDPNGQKKEANFEDV